MVIYVAGESLSASTSTLAERRSALALHPRENRPTRAILLKLGAIGCFALMSAIIKHVGSRYPTGEIIFFRNSFAFVPILFLLPSQGGWHAFRTRHLSGHILRNVAGLTAMFCSFTAITMIPFADATAINLAVPIVTTALAVPLLGEKVGLARSLAIGAGFIGVIFILHPGAGILSLGAIYALVGAIMAAFAMIAIRRMAGIEQSITIVIYFSLTCALVGAITLPFNGRIPGWSDAGLLALCGLFGGVAQLLMTNAYRLAPVSVIAPFDYTALLYALLLGYVIWGEVPTLKILGGAAIVIASGLFIFYWERPRRVAAR